MRVGGRLFRTLKQSLVLVGTQGEGSFGIFGVVPGVLLKTVVVVDIALSVWVAVDRVFVVDLGPVGCLGPVRGSEGGSIVELSTWSCRCRSWCRTPWLSFGRWCSRWFVFGGWGLGRPLCVRFSVGVGPCDRWLPWRYREKEAG